MEMKSKVLIAVPTMGALHPNLAAMLLTWQQEFPRGELSFHFTYRVSPTDRARNKIVKFFLEHPANFTHLLFVDSDTVPEADVLKRLLSHDKAVVSGLTPILHYNAKADRWDTFDNCFTHQDTDENGTVTGTHVAERHTGLKEIYRCGSSCILIKREVFEAIEKPYYQFLYNDDMTEHTRSEDINFCDKAREAGYTLYADTDAICRHYKEAVL